MNILLVDDEDVIHRTLGSFLSRSGHSVRRALDGAEALRSLGESIPDVVISDIKMPSMDGLELVTRLKLRTPGTPVVLITGHGDEEMAASALHTGAYDYFRKPVRLEELLSVIERIEEQGQLVRSLMLTEARRGQSQRPLNLGTLAEGIAHQIDSPLTAVRRNLQSLEEKLRPLAAHLPAAGVEGANGVAQLLDCATAGAERIQYTVQQILMCARTHTRQPHGPLDLAACLEQSLHETRVEREGIQLQKRFHRQSISGTDPELTQAFVCILRNAVQAIDGRAGGRIVVEMLSHDAGWVTVTVTDNGSGIPNENADHVFDPFFTTRGPGEGVGLGLAICQSIIAAHGGHVGFNAPSAQGCQFWVRLPCERPEPPEPPAPQRHPVQRRLVRRHK
jgi:two-component system, NtrC family, sensor kinase